MFFFFNAGFINRLVFSGRLLRVGRDLSEVERLITLVPENNLCITIMFKPTGQLIMRLGSAAVLDNMPPSPLRGPGSLRVGIHRSIICRYFVPAFLSVCRTPRHAWASFIQTKMPRCRRACNASWRRVELLSKHIRQRFSTCLFTN